MGIAPAADLNSSASKNLRILNWLTSQLVNQSTILLSKPIPHKTLRFVGLGLVAIVMLVAIIGETFSRQYKARIMARLPALAAKATDSLYDISIQNIRINIFTRVVRVYGLRMSVNLEVLQRRRAEGRPPHVILDVTVPEARIAGVKWDELKTEQSLLCRAVAFYSPEIRVQIMPEWKTHDSLLQRRTAKIKRVFAKHILIEDPSFDVRYSYGDDAFSVQTKGGLIKADDWDFHPNTAFDSTRFFAAREAQVTLTGIRYTYPGNLYHYSTERIEFDTRSGNAGIVGFHVAPLLSPDSMNARIGYRKEIYDCRVAMMRLMGLDWKDLLTNHRFYARRFEAAGADLNIYLDKRAPAPGLLRKGYFPGEILRRLNMPLRLDGLQLANVSVRYSEKHRLTGAVGTVEFNYLNALVSAMSNRPGDSAEVPVCRALVQGKFMHRSDLAAIIDFRLWEPRGAFDLKGRIQNLDAGQLSDAASAFALADISSLHVSDASMQIAGNADSTFGKFRIRYNDLKLKINRWNAIDSDVHSRYLLSFLANKLLLYKDNPMPGNSIREVETSVPRGAIPSFFPVLWKNVFQACIATAVRDEGALDIVKRKAANKGRVKQKFFRGLFPKRGRRGQYPSGN